MVDRQNFGSFLNELGNISNLGSYNVKPKLNPVKPTVVNVQAPDLPSARYSSTGGGGGGDLLSRLQRAIKGQESNNDYSAYNDMYGASGAYQILKSNFVGPGGWDKEALGRDISYSQFMNSRNLQDAIARYKLGQYLQRYGAAGAAVAWYGGPGAVDNMHDKSTQRGGYPSIYSYWNSVLNRM